MTTDTDRIEELAKWHDEMAYHNFISGGVAVGIHHERAIFLRSLSAKLTELRQAKAHIETEAEKKAKDILKDVDSFVPAYGVGSVPLDVVANSFEIIRALLLERGIK